MHFFRMGSHELSFHIFHTGEEICAHSSVRLPGGFSSRQSGSATFNLAAVLSDEDMMGPVLRIELGILSRSGRHDCL